MEPKGLIIAFTTACRFSLSRARSLSPRPRDGFPFTLQYYPPSNAYVFPKISLLRVCRTSAPLHSPIRTTWPAQLILFDLVTWIVFGGDYKTWIASLLAFILTTLFSNILSLPSLLARNQFSGPHKQKATLEFCTSLLRFWTEKGKKIQHRTAAGILWVKPKNHIRF